QNISGLLPAGLANPYIQWESTRKFEAGLELGFFKDRILVNMDYFDNHSSNQLLNYALPLFTGFSGISENFPATVRNYGWEFTASTVNIRSGTFSWKSSLNLTVPKNEL